MSCDCGSEQAYDACCGPYISGDAKPATAEQLMRSRYTAYARGHIDHIMSSHDPETVDEVDRDGAEDWSKQAEWDRLTVHRAKGGEGDDKGEVEFTAIYTMQGRLLRHRELATFRRIEGQWFYVDGEMVKPKPVVREGPKVGRNDPCTCGSGKKYKKCCGR